MSNSLQPTSRALHVQFSWKIGAPAGFGVMTTGLLMAKLATRAGAHVATYTEYPSLIQGGHNTYEITAAYDKPPYATKKSIDCLVCLNPETLTLHAHRLTENSLVVYDPALKSEPSVGIPVPVPFSQLQAELKADKIMINTIALGASAALAGVDQVRMQNLITDQFSGKKSADIAAINQQCALAGFNYIQEHHAILINPYFSSPPPATSDQDLSLSANSDQASTPKAPQTDLVMTGNEAFCVAATSADCKFYAAYPMTPTSTVLSILASWQDQSGMVVRHAEDEIAVINSALGASFAGARSAVGTSGGGFALMVEAISLAGITETPLVVLMGQRGGPATGMPTWTEQGDLIFTINAGHGEFPKIVLAPGDLQEMIELTKKAFDLADIYQTPVIILTDKYLGESHNSINSKEIEHILASIPNRGQWLTEWPTQNEPYLRYTDTKSGISPRLKPGTKGSFYQANSYEHLEDGHTTEDAGERIKQVNKRAKKIQTYLETDFAAPALVGEIFTEPNLTLVGWGSTKNPALAAQSLLAQQNIKINYLHFTHLYPLDESQVQRALSGKSDRYLLLENNATAQLGQLIRQLTGINLTQKLLKYNGRPLFVEEIVSAVQEAVA